MKSLLKIQSLGDGKFVDKVGKYVLEISTSRGSEDFWLSQKQAEKLFGLFNIDFDSAEFPCSAPGVFAAFEQRGQYFNFIWPGNEKDCAWLREKFGPFDADDEGPAEKKPAQTPVAEAEAETEEEFDEEVE